MCQYVLHTVGPPLSTIQLKALSPLDHFWGGCARLHQSAEEQVSIKEVLCQTPAAGLPACAAFPGGGQHANVSAMERVIKYIVLRYAFGHA